MSKFSGLKKKIKNRTKKLSEKTKGLKKSGFDFRQATKSLFIGLILAFGVFQLAFGIMIYAMGVENNTVKAAANIVPFPAAITTSGVVTVDQYLAEKSYIEHFYESTDQGDYDKDAVKDQIMKQLVENRLIYNEALKHKVYVSDAEVDQVFEQIVAENGGKEEVDKVLEDLYGLNAEQFKKLVRVQLLREKMDSEVLTKVRARHILIRVEEDASEEKVSEAKGKIDKYYQEIMDGMDFAEAAKEYSDDVGSAEVGGELAPFARGEMVPEFEDVAFATPVGEISEPFRTSFGWHIIKVEDKTGIIDESFSDWVTSMRKDALVINLYS